MLMTFFYKGERVCCPKMSFTLLMSRENLIWREVSNCKLLLKSRMYKTGFVLGSTGRRSRSTFFSNFLVLPNGTFLQIFIYNGFIDWAYVAWWKCWKESLASSFLADHCAFVSFIMAKKWAWKNLWHEILQNLQVRTMKFSFAALWSYQIRSGWWKSNISRVMASLGFFTC